MFISRIAKILVLLVSMVFVAFEASAEERSESSFNWDRVMDAIAQVESGGNAKSRSGSCCGAMQIKPCLVQECNLILRSRKSKKRFTLSDRFSVRKSREMFVLMMSKYNPSNNIERAIRMWNGGVRYKIRSTQRYYNKVMAVYNGLK